MKLAIDETFESSGLGETTEFKLKASPMAFKILSDGLYRDKIGAVVRELACNAYDAHVAAGTTDIPFYVHAPSYLEPFFEIRDYGIGLSEADVLNLYTTYFESTKSTSNEFIGALGLGSKSPFSYSNNFNVTSFFEGVQHDFCVFLDSRGMPTISKLYDQPTEEANGLKITIQMNKISEDGDLFRTAMRRYLSVFQNIDTSGIDIAKLEYVADFNTCRVIKDSNRYSMPMFQVKQGHVIYPLDLNMLKIYSNDIGFSLPSYHSFLIEAPIGSCAITASREELGYDDDTVVYLKQKVADIITEISTATQEAYNESHSMYPDDIFDMTYEFGRRVRDDFKCVNIEKMVIDCNEDHPKAVNDVLSRTIDQRNIMYKYLKWRKTNHKRISTYSLPCDNTNSMYIVYPSDKSTLPASCIQEFYERSSANEEKKLYFIKDTEVLPVVLKYSMTVAEFKAEYMPPRQISFRTKTIKDAIVKQQDKLYLKVLNDSEFKEISVSDLSGCYWLPHNFVSGDRASTLSRSVRELKEQNVLDKKPVYILNRQNIALYSKDMIHLGDAIISKVDEIAKIQLAGEIKELRYNYRATDKRAEIFNILDYTDTVKKFPALKPFASATLKFDYTSITILQSYFSFTCDVDFKTIVANHKEIFNTGMDNIKQRFPMLIFVDSGYLGSDKKKIVTDYINDILSKEAIKLAEIKDEEDLYAKVS